MTEIEQELRWENNVNEDEDWEGAQNSAKLFERSRIKALAGWWISLWCLRYQMRYNIVT